MPVAELDRVVQRVNSLMERVEHQHAAGKLNAALRICSRALAALEGAAGPRDPNVAPILATLGVLHQELRNSGAAARAYRRGLDLLSPRSRDPSIVALRAQLLRALGMMFVDGGEYRTATVLLRQGLRTAERLGKTHVELGLALNAFGKLCKYTGRFREGRAVYRRALAILRRRCGPRSLEVAAVLHNIGGIEHEAGRFAHAEAPARASVSITRRTLGTEHAVSLADEGALAAILQGSGRLDEAEGILARVLAALDGARHGDAFETAVTCHNLAAIRTARGDHPGALRYLDRAVALKQQALGRQHPDTAISLANRADALASLGHVARARSDLRRALSIFSKRLGPSHRNTKRCAACMRTLERVPVSRP